jgi:hypothetical protein
VEKRGGKRVTEREIESNAETQRALRIRGEERRERRKEKGERINTEGTEIGAQRSRRILRIGRTSGVRGLDEKVEIARVIYSAPKTAHWSCLLG